MRPTSSALIAACVAVLVAGQPGCSSDDGPKPAPDPGDPDPGDPDPGDPDPGDPDPGDPDPGDPDPGDPGPVLCAPIVGEPRTRLLFNEDWRFTRDDPADMETSLAYDDVRPWVLPTGNDFVSDPADRLPRPVGSLGEDVAYVSTSYDDSSWDSVELPHDYAIAGPFTPAVSVSMGQLPSPGVVWYRKTFPLPAEDAGNSIFLDIDGAMSYAMVWLNGHFVGGWPYGYASFRVDLTPYVNAGGDNVLAVRLDNPVPVDAFWQNGSARWYAGGGIYRNVWLVKTSPVHVGQWGTYLTTPAVSPESAAVGLAVTVDNDTSDATAVTVATDIYEIDAADEKLGCVASAEPIELTLPASGAATTTASARIASPKLWGIGPNQTPNRYVAVTTIRRDGELLDVYETPFGVRTLTFDPDQGFLLNGELVELNGVCNHHDLGALGGAVNDRAIQRQLEILVDMGANAIRTSHNPPAPELLDLADKMGILIMDEAFDVWTRPKTVLDYHLLFLDWYEQDLRAMLRRDRNHPSVIMWNIGNEVGEQTDNAVGGPRAAELTAISHEEDPTRPTVAGMNSASSTSAFAAAIDVVGLNYQGSGIRTNPPQYPVFHEAFPDKLVLGSETASVVSSRGVYTFPVAPGLGLPVSPTDGEDPVNRQVSSYGLYFPSYASTADEEFGSQVRYPFVAGQFVWTGFDYLGEPTPFDSRSSYYGIIDLAGFKKDLFYIYQATWRPDHPMAHILPHWTWPDRAGQVTPVHVYTSGDEAELFLNGVSLGRKAKAEFEYRLRWDDVVYTPGELEVVAYKGGVKWATDSVKTAGPASALRIEPDRSIIANDGRDLSYVTVTILDAHGQPVPRSMNMIHFEVSGPGEIVATDNGDPTDLTVFPSHDRAAFNSLALAIIRARRGESGDIVVTAASEGLAEATATIETR